MHAEEMSIVDPTKLRAKMKAWPQRARTVLRLQTGNILLIAYLRTTW